MLETSCCYYHAVNSTFKPVLAFLLCKGIIVSVRPAGWDNTVSRKRMSACLIRAKMVAAVWTDITATPVCAYLDSEVIIIIIIISSA